jgi:hypothetical protein
MERGQDDDGHGGGGPRGPPDDFPEPDDYQPDDDDDEKCGTLRGGDGDDDGDDDDGDAPPAKRRRADDARADDARADDARAAGADDRMTLAEFEAAFVASAPQLRAREWTTAELQALVGELSDKWALDREVIHSADTVRWACGLFGIPEADLGLLSNATPSDHPGHMNRRFMASIGVAASLMELVHDDKAVPSQQAADEMIERLGEVSTVMHHACELVQGSCRLMCTNSGDDGADPYQLGNRFLHMIKDTKRTPLQAILMDLSTAVNRNGWRQYDGHYYVPITIEVDGELYDTHAWEVRGTIQEMISALCDCHLEHARWQWLTSGRDMINQTAYHLMAAGPYSFQFPVLKFNRRLWAFTDGCYDGSTDTFYPHTERALPPTEVAIKFFDHPMGTIRAGPTGTFEGQREMRAAHEPVDAAFMVDHALDAAEGVLEAFNGPHELLDAVCDALVGYFELQCRGARPVENWLTESLEAIQTCMPDVEWTGRRLQLACRGVWRRHRATAHLCEDTPLFDQVLFTQGYDMATASLIYCHIGRLMYEVGEHDGWQVVLFVVGKGGTGKSVICRVARHMYPKQLVANISNNGEVKFGLSGVADKWLWICPEVKKNFCLDQAEFQSMVSGEELVLNVKHKTACTITWTAPGLLCGNEVFDYEDSQESLFRRIVAAYFDRMVDKRLIRTKLFEEMIEGPTAEFGRLLRKCNVAYRRTVEQVGDRDIWEPGLVQEGIVPATLHEFRTKFRAEIDSVVAFLTETDEIHADSGRCMSIKTFQAILSKWVRNAGAAATRRPPAGAILMAKLETLGHPVIPRGGDVAGHELWDSLSPNAVSGTVAVSEVVLGLFYEPPGVEAAAAAAAAAAAP